MKKSFLLPLLLVLTGIVSCFGPKKISREVRVSINPNFNVIIEKDPKGHFVDYYSADQYKQCFIEGITKQLSFKNIIINNDNPEYIIIIDKVVIKESLTTGMVKDSLSSDYKKMYDLTVGIAESFGRVIPNNSSSAEKWSATRERREKITNLQSMSGIAQGKDLGPHDYRKKPFDSYEFRDLVYDLSYKSGDAITSLISSKIK